MPEGIVEKLAFGGQGIIRHEGLVVFVPFVAPGDHIYFRITEKRKNFAKGEIVEILEKSSVRIEPVCPYFGVCGGCQLQHLNQQAQLEAKRQWIDDSLKRIGHLSFDKVYPVISASEWAYRRHVTLHLKATNEHFEATYITLDNQSAIKVDCCPIFLPLENSLLVSIQNMLSKLYSRPGNEGKLTIFKLGNGTFLLSFHFPILPKNYFLLKDYLGSLFSGIAISSPQKNLSWGIEEGTLEIDDLKFHFSPTSFIQNHPEQSLNIYRQILEIATSQKSQFILDLYCGIGISSLFLARKTLQVIGVESNAISIKLANKNKKVNHLNNVKFIHNDVKKALPKLLITRPDLVIINPPRTGVDPAVIQSLTANPPQQILYISCIPSTLARDLKPLCRESFKIELIQPFDMFPQTSHVETLVLINKV